MKNIKKYILILVLMVLTISPAFVGCNLSLDTTARLNTPIITLHSDSKCITWNTTRRTGSYDVYINSEFVESVSNLEDENSLLYDFSSSLNEDGEYKIYIIAISNTTALLDSLASNEVTYTYFKETPSDTVIGGNIDYENEINVTVSGKKVEFTPIDNLTVDTYLLYLYSNSTGLNIYEINNNVIDLYSNNYNLFGKTADQLGIYAIRIGYKIDGEEYLASDIVYYNPDNNSPYTDNIYIFDGLINDFYVESLQELNNLIYYSFIRRIQDFNIAVSDSFYSVITSSYTGDSEQRFNSMVQDSFGSFYETMAFRPANSNNRYVNKLSDRVFNIKVDYNNIIECDTTIEPQLEDINDQGKVVTYYEEHDFDTWLEVYGEDYDNFASDKQYLYTVVQTSEDLYWAVENKIVPVFDSTKSSAYVIYNQAKTVLRGLISDDMTDYEKTLCIFEWICDNTVYDHTSYTMKAGYSESVANYPMLLPCFYLEGVFTTGYSVCDGFSKAYSLMCNMIGIDCIRIVGDAKVGGSSGGHAWNKVKVDFNLDDNVAGNYYLVDITWTEIASNNSTEILSHEYFLVDDEYCKNTHFPHEERFKFQKYKTNGKYNYYLDNKFSYNSANHDYVISSDEEMSTMFEYFMETSGETIEVVFDLDYMIAYYESVNGANSYCSSNKIDKNNYIDGYTEYHHATDTFIIYTLYTNEYGYPILDSFGKYQYIVQYRYYYKLKNVFIECLRANKFAEQYVFIDNGNKDVIYDSDGTLGILYVFEQNLLIDDSSEPEHLMTFIKDKGVTGEYTIYIDNNILKSASGEGYTEKAFNLLNSYLASSNLQISLKLIDEDYLYGTLETEIATIFSLVITEKSAPPVVQ